MMREAPPHRSFVTGQFPPNGTKHNNPTSIIHERNEALLLQAADPNLQQVSPSLTPDQFSCDTTRRMWQRGGDACVLVSAGHTT